MLKTIQIENYVQSYLGLFPTCQVDRFIYIHSGTLFNNKCFYLFVFKNNDPDAMVEMCKYAGNDHNFMGTIFLYDL